jgi:hypothetical protein
MPTVEETTNFGPSGEALVAPAGLEIQRHASGVTVRLPRPTFGRLPIRLKISLASTVFVSLSCLGMHPYFSIGLMLLMTANVASYSMRVTEWKVENGELSVQHTPFGRRKRWKVRDVAEVKRAAEDSGLLVHIAGKDFLDVGCPANREVLEYAGKILSENVAQATARLA